MRLFRNTFPAAAMRRVRTSSARTWSYGDGGRRVQALIAAAGFAFGCIACVFATSFPALAQDRPVRIVVLGDSLSAGLGLSGGEAFPAKLARALKAKGIEVLLAGMLAPRNLGNDFTRKFDTIYPELAEKYGALLYPFFLDGVATLARLNQRDGLHPNAEGVGVIVKGILPKVEELVNRVRAKSPA